MSRTSRVLLLIALLSLTHSVFAQFQAPTPDELSSTSDPKYPGVAAIYLNRAETDDDNLHYHLVYERIKILTEMGLQLATIAVPYPRGAFKIADIKGRTIHPDGSIYPLTVKPEDLMAAKVGEHQLNKIVFTLPNVTVGSILEYRYQYDYDDHQLSSPSWDIQQQYPVRKSHFTFQPFKDLNDIVDSKGTTANKLLYTSVGMLDEIKMQHNAMGVYSLDVGEMPPMPHDEFMPPVASILGHVTFYYSPFFDKEEFWKTRGNDWSKDVNYFAEVTSKIKDVVNTLIAPGDTDEVKARKIYLAVQKLDNSDFTRRKDERELRNLGIKSIRRAEDIWAASSGSSDELTMLYIAMVRAAGLHADAIDVSRRDFRVFSPFFLSFDQLDDLLAIVTLGGKEFFLDPGQKMCPFGQLKWYHTLSAGLRQTDNGTQLVQTPGIAARNTLVSRTAALDLHNDGTVEGTVRVALNGTEALRWRQLALTESPDSLGIKFRDEAASDLPDGLKVDFDHFLGLDDPTVLLMGMLKVSGTAGTTTGKRLFLPASFFSARAHLPFVQSDKRAIAVDTHAPVYTIDTVSYSLQPGTRLESPLPPQTINFLNYGIYKTTFDSTPDSITAARSMLVSVSLFAPADYTPLHDFYSKINSADQQQLILIHDAPKPAQ